MLSDFVFNKTKWRSRGFSGIEKIKSVQNRIRCLVTFKFITQTIGPFDEHEKLADHFSSVSSVLRRTEMLTKKG